MKNKGITQRRICGLVVRRLWNDSSRRSLSKSSGINPYRFYCFNLIIDYLVLQLRVSLLKVMHCKQCSFFESRSKVQLGRVELSAHLNDIWTQSRSVIKFLSAKLRNNRDRERPRSTFLECHSGFAFRCAFRDGASLFYSFFWIMQSGLPT